jgi:hypothetical protein
MTKKQPKRAISPDDQLKAIYDVGHTGNFWDRHEEPYQTFGDLIFEGAGHSTFSGAIQALHKTNESIFDTVSEEDFTKAVIGKLRPFYDVEAHPNFSGLWKSISTELLGTPVGRSK